MDLDELELEDFTKHAWFVNLNIHSIEYIDGVVIRISNQGCNCISIRISSSFDLIAEQFRTIISQICASRLFILICLVDSSTDETLLSNISCYLRCCKLCILSSDVAGIDGYMIHPSKIEHEVGNLLLRYGNVSTDAGIYNTGSVSNCFRYNALSWTKVIIKDTFPVYYVGWHLLSYLYSMILCVEIRVYDLATFKCPSTYRSPSKKSKDKSLYYVPPNSNIKLGALAAWSLTFYDTVIVIGGYPGNEMRELNRYLSWKNKKIILIDPMFKSESIEDNVHIISSSWNFTFDVQQNLETLGIQLVGKSLILDDTWVNYNKWNFLMKKLYSLRPTTKHRNCDILIKFNWYGDSNVQQLNVSYMSDFLLLPGMNDSTESRILLKRDGSGMTINKRDYYDMMEGWKDLKTDGQTFAFGYYFVNSVIINKDILRHKEEVLPNSYVISLYALGNVCSVFRLVTLKYWESINVKFIINLYTNLTTKLGQNATMVGNVVCYKQKYRDRVYDYSDMLNLFYHGVYTITIDKIYNTLYNFSAPRLGFQLNGGIASISETVKSLNSRIVLTNFPMELECELQSSSFSFATRLKFITIVMRINRRISLNTTYMIRSDLVSDVLGSEHCQYDGKTKGVALKGLSWRALKIGVFNDTRILNMSEHVTDIESNATVLEISGHVLNLIMMELLECGNLLLWLKQIVKYYREYDTFNHTAHDAAWNRGYFIEVSKDRLLKKWHMKIDLLLACVICEDYWSRLLNLTKVHKFMIRRIAIFVYDVFNSAL